MQRKTELPSNVAIIDDVRNKITAISISVKNEKIKKDLESIKHDLLNDVNALNPHQEQDALLDDLKKVFNKRENECIQVSDNMTHYSPSNADRMYFVMGIDQAGAAKDGIGRLNSIISPYTEAYDNSKWFESIVRYSIENPGTLNSRLGFARPFTPDQLLDRYQFRFLGTELKSLWESIATALKYAVKRNDKNLLVIDAAKNEREAYCLSTELKAKITALTTFTKRAIRGDLECLKEEAFLNLRESLSLSLSFKNIAMLDAVWSKLDEINILPSALLDENVRTNLFHLKYELLCEVTKLNPHQEEDRLLDNLIKIFANAEHKYADIAKEESSTLNNNYLYFHRGRAEKDGIGALHSIISPYTKSYEDSVEFEAIVNFYIKKPGRLSEDYNRMEAPYHPGKFLENHKEHLSLGYEIMDLKSLWGDIALALKNAVNDARKNKKTNVLSISTKDRYWGHDDFSLPEDIQEKIDALTHFTKLALRGNAECLQRETYLKFLTLRDSLQELILGTYDKNAHIKKPVAIEEKAVPGTFTCDKTGMTLSSGYGMFSAPATNDNINEDSAKVVNTRSLVL